MPDFSNFSDDLSNNFTFNKIKNNIRKTFLE